MVCSENESESIAEGESTLSCVNISVISRESLLLVVFILLDILGESISNGFTVTFLHTSLESPLLVVSPLNC